MISVQMDSKLLSAFLRFLEFPGFQDSVLPKDL